MHQHEHASGEALAWREWPAGHRCPVSAAADGKGSARSQGTGRALPAAEARPACTSWHAESAATCSARRAMSRQPALLELAAQMADSRATSVALLCAARTRRLGPRATPEGGADEIIKDASVSASAGLLYPFSCTTMSRWVWAASSPALHATAATQTAAMRVHIAPQWGTQPNGHAGSGPSARPGAIGRVERLGSLPESIRRGDGLCRKGNSGRKRAPDNAACRLTLLARQA